jgi:capsule polysaccharide export protein KpsE/RkpR
VTARLEEANTALEVAERDLNAFRMQNNLPSPEAELGAAVNTRLTLDAQIRGKEVEIETARRFQTDNSMRVRTLVSELAALRRQRAEADQASNGENALALSSQTAEYFRLYREQKFAETIMLVYRRFFEEVSVEALSAETTVQVIERPHIDPDRQFNLSGIALLLLVLLAAAFTEIYAPMTGLARRPRRPEPQDPR